MLAYDDGCGPCTKFKALIEFVDVRRRIRFVSLRQADGTGALSSVEPSMRYRSFHLAMSGEAVLSGSDALLPLMRLLSPMGALAWTSLESIPGLRRSVSFLYSTVSRLHGRAACASEASRA